MNKQTKSKTYIPAASTKPKTTEAKQPTADAIALAKYRKKRFWTLGVISLATVIVLTFSIIFATWQPPVPEEIENKAKTPIADNASLKNGSFDFVKSDSFNVQYPYIPTSWTITKDSDLDSVIGIINTGDDWGKVEKNLNGMGISFSSSTTNKLKNGPNYDITEVSKEYGDNEDYVDTDRILMIYNHDTTVANVHSASFSISNSKYYAISVWVLTDLLDTTDEGAYIWLTTSSSTYTTPEARFEGIKASVWTQYTFYVEASKTTSTTLYLSFGLGRSSIGDSTSSKGVAFFDYAVSVSTTKGDYIAAENALSSRETTFKSFAKATTDNKSETVAADFSNSSGALPLTSLQFETQHADQGKLPFYSSGKADIYYINNMVSPKNGLHISFESFKVAAPSTGKNYRLSFWVKTSDMLQGTGAYAYLTDKTLDGTQNKTTTLGPINTPEKPEDNTFNGWTEYIYFIRPSNTIDYTLQLQIYMGRINNIGMEVAKGKMFVADIELTEIEPQDFSNSSSGATSSRVDLAVNSTDTIANGSFDNSVTNVGGNYPLPPANWNLYYAGMAKVDGDNKNIAPSPSNATFYGIMNVLQDDVNLRQGLVPKDFPEYGGNNVLMLRSTIKTAMGVQSDNFTLSADSFYQISVLVKVLDGAKANVYLISEPTPDDEIENNDIFLNLSSGGIKYYQTEGEVDANGYKRYNFFITTGYFSKTVKLELWLGDRDATDESGYSMGTVLFDQASCTVLDKDAFRKFVGSQESVALIRKEVRDEEDNLIEVELSLSDESIYNVAGRDLGGVDVEPEADDDEEEEEETPPTSDVPTEPFNWLQVPALAIALTLLFVIFARIIRKFKPFKASVSTDEPEYKRK